MKRKKSILVSVLLISSLFAFLNSCEKDDVKSPPILTTTSVSEVTQTTAISGGNITNDGGAPVTARGVCWSTNETPSLNDSKTTDGTGIGDFSSGILDLIPNTTYYVRAYAINSEGTSYGKVVSVKTLEALATLTTVEVTEITTNTAISGGNITDDGGVLVSSRGVCWSTNGTPTINDSITSDGSGIGSFISNLSNLLPNTLYYLRAFATNDVGTVYGNQISFNTSSSVPYVTTPDVIEITPETAIGGGTITSDGGSEIVAHGVCWSTQATPTTDDNIFSNDTIKTTYYSLINSLEQNTTYYVRAFATNSIGTGYGEDVIFTTPERSVDSDFKPMGLKYNTPEELRAVPTDEFYSPRSEPMTRSSELNIQLGVPPPGRQIGPSCVGWAVGYGMMSYLFNSVEGENDFFGNVNIFSPYYIWNQVRENIHFLTEGDLIKAMQLVQDQGCCKISDMPTTFTFMSQLPSPTARINAAQYKITDYKRCHSFDLKKFKQYLAYDEVPIVIGLDVDAAFQISNSIEQFEKRDGRLVWTKYKNKIAGGHAVLICGFDDKINAFKVLNSWGTNWGDDGYFWLDYDFAKTAIRSVGGDYFIFVAHVNRPIFQTKSVTEITGFSAKSGGVLIEDWDLDVLEKGICWGTETVPANFTNKIKVSGRVNEFTSTITGLSPGATYYVSAYAKNKHGISYGKPIKFTTSSTQMPTIKTASITNYSSTSATVGGEVTNDGGSAVTERGVYYRKSTDPEQREEKLKIASGKGTFSAVIRNLEPNTTYFVRAYAVNSQGTAYGNQVTLKTLAELPTLTTTSLSNIAKTSVDTGGNITSDGGSHITARGVCYDTAPNPAINGDKTSNGTGVGSFVSSLSGLTVGVTYYIRAYATNSVGTVYGKELRFNGLTEEINEIVPEEILEEIKALGMPINTGTAPPNIAGVYNFSPVILKNSNIAEDTPGGGFNDGRIKIYDQSNTNLTAKFESVEVDSNGEVTGSSIGDEAHITHVVGNSSNFTLFVRVVATEISGEWAELIYVYSGTMAGGNINSLHFALVMLNNNGYEYFIDNGEGRLFYDEDGVSERIPSLNSVLYNTRSTSGVELPSSISKQKK